MALHLPAAGFGCSLLVAAALAGPAWAQPPQTTPPAEKPATPRPNEKPAAAVAFPHPMISEVLFAVPIGAEGDSNRDGKRSVSGDEFIELVNPHDRPIELRGYTVTDGAPNAKSQVRFVFPAMVLPARAVVVVFNGHDSKIPGPIGDAKSAPSGVSDSFHKAAVFSLRTQSSRASFSNAGDAACLKAPDGRLIQRVRWGKADATAGGSGFGLDETAPTTTKGSVQRDGVGKDAAWNVHPQHEAAPFSPGVFAPFQAAAPPSASPAPSPPPEPPRP